MKTKFSAGKSRLLLFFGALLSARALTVTMAVGEVEDEGIAHAARKGLYTFLEQAGQGLTEKGLLLTVLTLCLYVCYRKFWIEGQGRTFRFGHALALVLAVLYTGGQGFLWANSPDILFSPRLNLVRSCVTLAGSYAFYLWAANALYALFHSGRDIRMEKGLAGPLLRLYRKHPWLTVWIGILLLWSGHLVLRYPAAMSYDNWAQLGYYFGTGTWTTAQPVFHTWLFGVFVHLGLIAGSANAGLFAFVLFQTAVMAAVLAWSLTLMRRWQAPAWIRLLTFAVICFAPYYAGYAAFPIKDFLYTACFLLLVLGCMELVQDPARFFKSRLWICLWVLGVGFMILFRKNGVYVYVPVALLIVLNWALGRILGKRTSFRGKALITPVLCLLLPLVLSWGAETAISVRYDVQKDTPKEMLSLPFQQTARFVRDFGGEIPAQEQEVIRKVLDYDNLPRIYNPMTADPVKTTYRAESTADLAAYFKLWLRQFFRHPLCYVEATWNQNYYLFAPYVDNIVYNKNCYSGAETLWDEPVYETLNIHIPESLEGLDAVAVSLYSLLTKLPVIGMLNNVAFYMILMTMVFVFMLADRRKKEQLFVMLPLILSFLIILMAPQIQDQPRYAFPVIYAMPSVTAFYLSGCRRKERDGQSRAGCRI